ncbi:MAG TPA: NIPSNAP family protein [Ramlibacter sp.]|jgi:hypothetical protein|uniref:NIPSNAP family protein n=1 Tax=Ramlibacter sp. TaxID=1917967 RepID=UPI002D6171E2|nr:NIPSNAP family protein [Ramlibacter sp.]HZY17282.1 NIPSNAP family protein [Ramlibacter sp.]
MPADHPLHARPAPATAPGVVELRQYTLHPGQRERLIALFEREFVEPQEAAGMQVLGQFRDEDAPDRFVWLRGFRDMDGRRDALHAFYDGPVWAAHRDAANATMVDSDDVLLLRPAWTGSGLPPGGPRAPLAAVDTGRVAPGRVRIAVFPLQGPAPEALLLAVRDAAGRHLASLGARASGWYVSESAPNTFPRLPVRADTHVLVGVALFDAAPPPGADPWAGVPSRWIAGPVQRLRLAPTTRSSLGS